MSLNVSIIFSTTCDAKNIPLCPCKCPCNQYERKKATIQWIVSVGSLGKRSNAPLYIKLNKLMQL